MLMAACDAGSEHGSEHDRMRGIYVYIGAADAEHGICREKSK
jgi:hypothetical protein